jgi:hypothetical protein
LEVKPLIPAQLVKEITHVTGHSTVKRKTNNGFLGRDG